MLLRCVRAHCIAPGGLGCIRKYIQVLMRSTRESGKSVYGSQTDLHFGDVGILYLIIQSD